MPGADIMDDTAIVWREFKEFLEGAPPNLPRRFSRSLIETRLHGGSRVTGIFWPRLDLHCDEDGGVRRFSPNTLGYFSAKAPGRTLVFGSFTCPDCRREEKSYALLVNVDDSDGLTIIKLGESPAFGNPISRRMQKRLGEDLELFRQGQRCEAQGLGIGAASYFRRIVERRWKHFVRETRDIAARLGQTDLEDYDAALSETRFTAAVDKLKGRIPDKLRLPSGDNPLVLLHDALSVGIHELSDADNLAQAEAIRRVMTELFEQIDVALSDRADLTEAIKKLSEARARKAPEVS